MMSRVAITAGASAAALIAAAAIAPTAASAVTYKSTTKVSVTKVVKVVAPAPVATPAPPPDPFAEVPAGGGNPASFTLELPNTKTAELDGSGWTKCRTITYRVNLDQAPASGLADVQETLRRVTLTTGLKYQFGGIITNKYLPGAVAGEHRTTRPANTDMVIAWSDAAKTPALGGNVIGNTNYHYWVYNTGWRSIFQADVLLDVAANRSAGVADGSTWGSLLLHEMGHAIGLGHSSDSTQVMTSSKFGWFQAGDRAGLAAIGYNPRAC